MAFGKRSSKSTRSTNKTNSFKRFGEKEKPAKKQREDKPWAIYNPKLGVIFAKQNRRGDCYAAQVDPDEAEALVKRIEQGKEKGIFTKDFFHKPAFSKR